KRLDDDATNMVALALENMRARVYEEQFPDTKARRFLPVNNEEDPGHETFSYEETTFGGSAKVIRNYADDPPSVETSGRKVTHGIVSLGDSYFYSIQDMRRAAVSGRPLVARKARAARVVYERGLDGIAAFGAPDDGIENGLLNKPIGTSAGQIRGTAATAADF